MNNFFRALIAGYGAKKLGGGCFSTIIIFIIIYTLLGKCGNESRGQSTGATQVKPKTEVMCQSAPVTQKAVAKSQALR
ncbi:hypothetical protein KHS38_15680 [Mucilaginibacter sp. Bleaf8]|uniref:hypothetical protein n=1 Tax=Mucilaginibacter sp. Bleaf8 TaxID=2834430 RepID=UPI001BD054A7|nr:hypothetical protein [Mucilaginibacter sp. Bleaf8]MBS7565848.1 hypothetical protein [Mucilaginibacter sp. Bleaf8]